MSSSNGGLGEGSVRSLEDVLYHVKRVIVGQDALLERMAVALVARGHLLVEGVPGLAKTLAVKTFAEACILRHTMKWYKDSHSERQGFDGDHFSRQEGSCSRSRKARGNNLAGATAGSIALEGVDAGHGAAFRPRIAPRAAAPHLTPAYGHAPPATH